MRNAFRPYKGKWLIKEFILDGSVTVEKGNLMEYETETLLATNPVCELATADADAIIGIACKDYPSQSPDTNIKCWVPAERKAEMIGRITAGVAVGGATDLHRPCDVQTHEGVDVDDNTERQLFLVRVTKATTDGSVTAGEGIFRIVKTPEFIGGFVT